MFKLPSLRHNQLIDFSLDTGPKVKINVADLLLGNVHRLLNDLGDAVLTEATENLERNGQWVTGHLAKSGHMKVDKAEMEVTVIFDAPYAAAVEYGSRPHAAPLGPSLPVDIVTSPVRGTKRAKIKRKVVSDKRHTGFTGLAKGFARKISFSGTPDPNENPFDYWAWRRGKRQIIKTKYGYHTKLGYGVWLKILKVGGDPHPYLRPAIDTVRAFLGFYAKKYGLDVTR